MPWTAKSFRVTALLLCLGTPAATQVQQQFRLGGTITNSVFAFDSQCFLIGFNTAPSGFASVTNAGVTKNVCQDSYDIQSVPSPSSTPRGQGIEVAAASGSGVSLTGNLLSHVFNSGTNTFGIQLDGVNGSYPATTGVTVTGNVICDWASPLVDNGTSNTTTGNTTQAANCTGLGFLDLTRDLAHYDSAVLGGAGTVADFIAKAEANSMANYNASLLGSAVAPWIRACRHSQHTI